MDAKNVLKQDLNKVWFDLKETNTDSESDCFDFKRFQKENIRFNENASRYEVGLSFKEYQEILSDNYFNCKTRVTLANLLHIFFGSYSANTQNISVTTLKVNVII